MTAKADKSAAETRRERQAAALRANLRRRKDQQRARDDAERPAEAPKSTDDKT